MHDQPQSARAKVFGVKVIAQFSECGILMLPIIVTEDELFLAYAQ